jgi:hypothetical protein
MAPTSPYSKAFELTKEVSPTSNFKLTSPRKLDMNIARLPYAKNSTIQQFAIELRSQNGLLAIGEPLKWAHVLDRWISDLILILSIHCQETKANMSLSNLYSLETNGSGSFQPKGSRLRLAGLV